MKTHMMPIITSLGYYALASIVMTAPTLKRDIENWLSFIDYKAPTLRRIKELWANGDLNRAFLLGNAEIAYVLS